DRSRPDLKCLTGCDYDTAARLQSLKLRGQDENTVEVEKCIRALPFDTHSGAGLCACLRAVGETPDRLNPARARWQAEPFGTGTTIARRTPGPVGNLGT